LRFVKVLQDGGRVPTRLLLNRDTLFRALMLLHALGRGPANLLLKRNRSSSTVSTLISTGRRPSIPAEPRMLWFHTKPQGVKTFTTSNVGLWRGSLQAETWENGKE